jgi:hypothetical protein
MAEQHRVAVRTSEVAIVAPPPGMLVITIETPVICSKYFAIVRALKSVSPPGLAPMMTLIVRFGQSVSANAVEDKNAPAENAKAIAIDFFTTIPPIAADPRDRLKH